MDRTHLLGEERTASVLAVEFAISLWGGQHSLGPIGYNTNSTIH